jgi:hypothetical protein
MRKRARRVTTKRGRASATIAGEVIELRDGDGALIVRYDAERGETVIAAARGDLVLAADQGRVVIRAAEASIEVSRLEVRATRIIERAAEVYREVDTLMQTRAGRLRTLVAGAFSLLAGSTHIASEEDTAIDGKRILLG